MKLPFFSLCIFLTTFAETLPFVDIVQWSSEHVTAVYLKVVFSLPTQEKNVLINCLKKNNNDFLFETSIHVLKL